MKHSIFILLFSFSVFSACSQGLQPESEKSTSFKKAPYLLYTGSNTEMLVLWQTTTSQNCTLTWGTDTTYTTGSVTTSEYGNDHQHKHTISGLASKTKYFYKVTFGDGEIKKGSFISAPEDTDKKISFYAYGDTRTYPSDHNQLAAQILQDMEQHPEMQTFIISTGDLVADGDKESDWENQFFDMQYGYLQQMLSQLPYMAAVGNHEGQGLLFRKYFPYPQFVSDRYYFSFDYGPAHFMVVDQFTDYSPGSDQYNWLVNELESTGKEWKFILLHEPGWSAGGVHPNNPEVQEVIQPLCETYGVQFVLTGHNHYYARAVVNGVMHITTGGGGAPLYNPNANADKIVKVKKAVHYTKIEIDNDSLTFQAITSGGELIETFTLTLEPQAVNDEIAVNPFKIFSTGSLIYVQNEKSIKGRLSVLDNYGRLVRQRELTSGENAVRVGTTGIYFVRVDYEGKRVVKKIFVNGTN